MDLLSLRAILTLDKSAYEQGLNEAESDVSSHSDSMSGLLGKIGGIAGGVVKVVSAGVAAGATATAALVKQSVGAYASYEQLSGGIAKLFGAAGNSIEQYAASQGKSVDDIKDEYESLMSAQTIVMDNAKQAYKTVGVSANEYMETVSGFSAALVNSLGGDTVKAAESADVAMRAMADNVNTFGSDMKSVQFAFQGFAKQNYTMLDNLKLGYGGTKEEMKRLIEDANTYAKSIGEAGDLSMDSFADIVTAIDLIQQKQNIAGTTSKEAASTIEGSLGSVKGAWENLVAGFSNPDADLGELINNVVTTATTAFGNLMPTIERAVEGAGSFIANVAPVLVEEIPKMVVKVAPGMIKAGISLVNSIKDGIVSAVSSIDLPGVVLPALIDLTGQMRGKASEFVTAGAEVLRGLGQGMEDGIDAISEPIMTVLSNLAGIITDNAPILFEVAGEMLTNLVDGISEGLPGFLENTALPMLLQFSEVIRENAGNLVDIGIELVLKLAQGIIDSIPTLLEQLPQIVINIAGVINDNAPKLIAGGIRLIRMLISGIISAVPALIANFPQIFQAILAVWSALNWLDLGKSVITFIKNGITALQTQIPNTIKDIGKKAIEFFKGVNWANAGSQAINFIVSAIKGLFSLIPNTLKSIGSSAVSAFKSINWFDLGANIIRGIVNGISSNVGAIVDAAKDAAKSAFDAAKNFLGIKSPSRLFRDEVGAMIPKGLAMGIDQSAVNAIDAASNLARDVFESFDGVGSEYPTDVITRSPYDNQSDSGVIAVLTAILEFLRENWNNGNPFPVTTPNPNIGYYDRALGVIANMKRRGVV